MNEMEWSEKRDRGKTLLIVEGRHEKEDLFYHLLKAFPEVDIDEKDIITYETNIYVLIRKIVGEYGEDWDKEDIDLPFLISSDKGGSKLQKRDFKNIYLIFDYERHDPYFSEAEILRMQNYFSQPEDVGKLYINYPMVESYLDLKCIPDESYAQRRYSSKNKCGSVYKASVTHSPVLKLMAFPGKAEQYLSGLGLDEAERSALIGRMGRCSTEEEIDALVTEYVPEDKRNNASHYFKGTLPGLLRGAQGCHYEACMRWAFRQIICHNVRKATKIQCGTYDFPDEEMKARFERVNSGDILRYQNALSDLNGAAEIDVLNMSVFLIPDYNTGIAFSDGTVTLSEAGA